MTFICADALGHFHDALDTRVAAFGDDVGRAEFAREFLDFKSLLGGH